MLVGCVASDSELRLRQEAEQSALERAKAASAEVVVVPSSTNPTTYWKLYLSDSGSAAAAGAQRGAGIGTAPLQSGSLAILVVPLTVPAGALIGSFYGAAMTVDPAVAAVDEKPVAAAVAEMSIQADFARAMRDVVVAEAGYPARLAQSAGEPATTLGLPAGGLMLETSIQRIGFAQQLSRHPTPPLAMTAIATLRTGSGQVLQDYYLGCTSPPHAAPAWAREQAALFKEEITACYRRMAFQVVRRFLVGLAVFRADLAECAVTAEAMPVANHWTGRNVDSLVPTLRWHALAPELAGAGAGTVATAGLPAISYDLAIWKGMPITPDEGVQAPIYYRTGLTGLEHGLEEPLEPSTHYSYSVRARFLLNGRPRITPWARVDHCKRDRIEMEAGEFTEETSLKDFYWLRTP